MLEAPIEIAAMKTTVLLVAASALFAVMPVPAAHAQAYPSSKVPPPPGMNDPGVQATAPAASSAASPAATPKPDLQPLTLPAMKSGDSRMGRPDSEPTVQVRQQGENTVQEYSRNGRVYMVVVTPRHGLQQTYMVDPQGRLIDEHGKREVAPAMYKVLEWGNSKPATEDSSQTNPDENNHRSSSVAVGGQRSRAQRDECLAEIGAMQLRESWLLFALGSALFAALTALFGKLGVVGINSNLATFIRTIVILIVTAGILSLRQEWAKPAGLPLHSWLFLVLSGIATGLSWLCYYRALQLGPVSKVAPIDKLSVALAIVLGLVFLGERPSWPLLIGGVLIVAGAVVIALF